jgi:hypothetical protein
MDSDQGLVITPNLSGLPLEGEPELAAYVIICGRLCGIGGQKPCFLPLLGRCVSGCRREVFGLAQFAVLLVTESPRFLVAQVSPPADGAPPVGGGVCPVCDRSNYAADCSRKISSKSLVYFLHHGPSGFRTPDRTSGAVLKERLSYRDRTLPGKGVLRSRSTTLTGSQTAKPKTLSN